MTAPVSITRCPTCHTAFHVTVEELGLAGGKVRCGSCLQVFMARDQMVVEQKSLFDSAPVLESRSSGDSDANDLPVAEFFVGSQPADVASASNRQDLTWIWASTCALLLLLLPLQLLIWQPQQLVRHAWYPPFLESACGLLGCRVRPVDHIQLMQVEGAVHSAGERFLSADLRITNGSPLAQPLPDLQLQFRNLQGRDVASRLLDPAEYLPFSDQPDASVLEPGQSISMRFDLVDPGPEAVNYEFSLFANPAY